MSTATAAMPTTDQLEAYAQKMPQVYRDIFATIPKVSPNRRAGDSVLATTVRNYLSSQLFAAAYADAFSKAIGSPNPEPATQSADLTDPMFELALDRLAELGFIQDPDETPYGSIIPTELGERLIEVITGVKTPRINLPELPKPTW